MKKIIIFYFLTLVFGLQISFAAVSFNANSSKVNFQTTNGTDNYLGAETINNHDFGTKGSTSYFHFKAAEAWIAKNNSSDVTGITFFYRIYKSGSNAPDFTTISLPYGEQNGSDPIYQRWGKYDIDVDIMQNVNSEGVWYFECLWNASTNHVNCDNPTWNSNGGNNFKGSFYADGSVPVELTKFDVLVKEKVIHLNWQTATEINNYGFDVERALFSTSPINVWTKIGFVRGYGNSNSPKNYFFIDSDVLNGSYIYRLKQIDTDGNYEYSPQVEVTVNNMPAKFELSQNYPNPFNPSTVISYALPSKEFVLLKVYNVLGNEIATLVSEVQEAGNYKVEFDASSNNISTSGVYLYRLEVGTFVKSRKMTLVK
jgi:hypothetical protein